jgi:Major Facilitator Superfamily
MVSELYADTLRARVLSAISGIWGVAALLGPMVGGMFAASGWWRGGFWITAPVLLPLSILAWYTLPPGDIQRGSGPVPLLRLALLGIGVLSVAARGQVTSTAAATWVYRLGIIAPLVLVALAWRLVRLHQRIPRGIGIQNVRAEY